MDTTLRLFFAIQLSDKVRNELTELIQILRAESWGKYIRWVHTENLHITLRFIGKCDPQQVPILIQHVYEAIKSIAPFSLQFGPVRLFPSPSHPHVITVTMIPSPNLLKLAQAVEQGVTAAGFAAESRAFLPHLSLGRPTHRGTLKSISLPDIKITNLEIQSISLLHSEHAEGKRRYTSLKNITLSAVVHPQVAVGAIVIKDNKVLLVKRKRMPNQGLWAIPGGKVQVGETLQQTAEREVKEETGITIHAKEPIYVFDLIDRDEQNNLRFHYVIIDLTADYVSGDLCASDDAAEARWVSPEEFAQLPLTETTRQVLQEKIRPILF